MKNWLLPFLSVGTLGLALVLVLLAGCAGMQVGDAPEWADSESEVTNGLAGAFFNDGSNGDVRARTENFFAGEGKTQGFTSFGEGLADTNDDGLPDARNPAGLQAKLVDTTGDGLPDQLATGTARPDRMLIYSGQVLVEVARAEDAAKDFLAKIEAWGGFLQQQSGTDLTVRLPAKHFDSAFAAAREAGRVLSEARRANDVTEEFVDLGIRVDNARRSRDRLIEILKLATEVEDILRVEKELRRLTEEIERMEGRLKFLRDQVSMATLRVQFQSIATAPPVRHQRQRSRFGWINRIGSSNVMEGF